MTAPKIRIWNASALAAELRDGTLSEAEKAGYVLALVVGQTAMEAISGRAAGALGGPGRFLSAALLAAVSAAGLVACFRANQRGDGVRFIERVMCLALPVLVRWYVLTLAVYYGVFLMGRIVGWWTPDSFGGEAGRFRFWAFLLSHALFFAMLRRYVALAASRAPD